MVLRRCGDCPETETESCDDRELPTLEQVSWWSPRWWNIEEIFAHVFHWIWNACGSLLILQLKPVSIECNGFFHNSKWITDAISSVQKTLATSELAFFWSAQVIGAWRDDDGAVYTITMDASGDSASASIKRQDGRRFEAKETIKCGEQGWRHQNKAMGPCHSPKEGWNLESLKGRGAPQWCIVFFHVYFRWF